MWDLALLILAILIAAYFLYLLLAEKMDATNAKSETYIPAWLGYYEKSTRMQPMKDMPIDQLIGNENSLNNYENTPYGFWLTN